MDRRHHPFPERIGDGSYFFARSTWVWGWAIWKRAWRHYDIGVRDFPAFRRSGGIARISPYRPLQQGHMALFELAYRGEWNNWDAQATFTIWNRDGVCIIPNGNLITNIGFGELAENTKWEDEGFPYRPVGPLVHPSDRSVRQDYDIRAFDAHCGFMTDYANNIWRHRMPFFSLARRIYRVLPGRGLMPAGSA